MRPIAIVLLLAAIAGCSDPEGPVLVGEWTGNTRDRADDWTFRFEAAGNPRDPAGTLEHSSPGGTARGTFSGTYDHPSLTLHLRVTVDGVDPPVEHPAEYHATVNDELDGMEGTMVIEDRTYPLILRRTQ